MGLVMYIIFVKIKILRKNKQLTMDKERDIPTEYVCTSHMVKEIAEKNGRNIRLVKVFNPIIKDTHIKLFDKVFGNLTRERV